MASYYRAFAPISEAVKYMGNRATNVKSQMHSIRPGVVGGHETGPSYNERDPRAAGSRGIDSRKPDVSRQQNLILFGLSEEHSLIDSKCIVDEVLEFLVNKPVGIKDLVRIGRIKKAESASVNALRSRPLLIKFDTVWDRQLVLASKRKLKQFRVERLFLREDLSLEVRQRRFPLHSHSALLPLLLPLPMLSLFLVMVALLLMTLPGF